MADLKPLGSEKLNGDDKLKRILELTYYGNNNKSSNSSRKAELVKESTNGGVFGIVKEKDGYYVKRGLNESSLDYIGGMFMKNKNKFNSYAEALKRLELLKGQEELNEATKYVLKQSKGQTEAPAAAPSMDTPPPPPPAPAPEMDGDAPAPTSGMDGDAPAPEMDGDAPAPESTGGEDQQMTTSKRSDYMAEVQKYAGKLGQELRDLHDRMESDDIKYVLNMIISAVDLDKLDDEDIEEIGDKFDRDEEGEEEVPMSTEEPDGQEVEPSSEENLSEEDDAMSKLDEFISAPELGEVDLEDYTLDEIDEPGIEDYHNNSSKERFHVPTDDDLGWEDDFNSHEDSQMEMSEEDMSIGEEDVEKEIDLEEIKSQISKAVGETLSKHFK